MVLVKAKKHVKIYFSNNLALNFIPPPPFAASRSMWCSHMSGLLFLSFPFFQLLFLPPEAYIYNQRLRFYESNSNVNIPQCRTKTFWWDKFPVPSLGTSLLRVFTISCCSPIISITSIYDLSCRKKSQRQQQI